MGEAKRDVSKEWQDKMTSAIVKFTRCWSFGAQKKEELVLSGAVENVRWVRNAFMEMLAEFERQWEILQVEKEKGNQGKRNGMDKSTCMKKLSFEFFPVCFAVSLCDFCWSCGTLSVPNRKNICPQIFLFLIKVARFYF